MCVQALSFRKHPRGKRPKAFGGADSPPIPVPKSEKALRIDVDRDTQVRRRPQLAQPFGNRGL